ncbi:MAG: hypothetical protein AAGD14_12295, partial [Planctomycetota bacterium]
MRQLLLVAALLGSVALALPGSAKPVRVKLKTGARITGYVIENQCTDAKLVIRDMKTKRKMTIPWAQVKPSQATELRVKLGFEVAESSGGEMVEGDVIRNRTGNLFKGLVLNRETARKDGRYKLKTADGIVPIRLSDVREERRELLDARVIYTPDELYEMKVKASPPESAQDHYQIAEYARIMGALPQAKQHYETVLSLGDPKYPESAIKRLIENVETRMNSADAEGKLKEIERHIVYNRFDKAKEALDAFRRTNGENPV